jgi:hypothetical protein
MLFYCESDGAGPKPPIDWTARQRAIDAIKDDAQRDAAQVALDAERLAQVSHVVRNGNGPWSVGLSPAAVAALIEGGALLEFEGASDGFGGKRVVLRISSEVSADLYCPECSSPVRLASEE